LKRRLASFQGRRWCSENRGCRAEGEQALDDTHVCWSLDVICVTWFGMIDGVVCQIEKKFNYNKGRRRPFKPTTPSIANSFETIGIAGFKLMCFGIYPDLALCSVTKYDVRYVYRRG
jgi:hypothetical protein